MVAAVVAAALAGAPSALGATIYGLTGSSLVRFDSSSPGTIQGSVAISGGQGGFNWQALDCRPATGQLYLVEGDIDSSAGRLYTVNPQTGVATPVGPNFSFSGSSASLDFNPVVDLARVVTPVDENFRLNPTSGAKTTDANLAFAAGDPNAGQNPSVRGIAYTNNVPGAASTTLFGIDSVLDVLVRLDSPNAGTLNTVGPLGVNFNTVDSGFDVAPNGTAFAAEVVTSPSTNSFLYAIDLVNGQATSLGQIGSGLSIRGLTAQCGGPTAVRIHRLAAQRMGRSVVVRWRTGPGAGAVGFDVYREQRGRRVRVTRSLVPASFLGGSRPYSVVDRRAPGGTVRYWLHVVGLDGSRSWHGPATAR